MKLGVFLHHLLTSSLSVTVGVSLPVTPSIRLVL